MICLVNAVNHFNRQESGYSDTRGSEVPGERFVGDGHGPVLRGSTGESMVDEALMEEACWFVGFWFMLNGGEEQRVERGMLLLDDTGDFAVAPDVAAAFEPGNERERDESEHGPAIQALRDGVTIQRGQQEGSAHENAEREDNGQMAEESRATQGLANFSNAGVEDGACDHDGGRNVIGLSAASPFVHGFKD